MKNILVAMLIATMMLLALSTAADVTKSTTTATSTPSPDTTKSTTTTTNAPGPDATQSTTTSTSTTPASEPTSTSKSTTTTTTPGFEATFAVVGILAVTFIALRRRH